MYALVNIAFGTDIIYCSVVIIKNLPFLLGFSLYSSLGDITCNVNEQFLVLYIYINMWVRMYEEFPTC